MQVATNVTHQQHHVSREKRGQALGHGFRGCCIWLTGLSGAGKTAIAFQLEAHLVSKGIPAYGLDGDNLRTGLNKNLGFSESDREENIRRVAEVAKLFSDSGVVSICSFVSPFAADREMARNIHKDASLPFFEVFVDTPIEVCESRDVKGLYKKARQGLIKGFTGVDQPYEKPESPDLILKTVDVSIEENVHLIVEMLLQNGIIPMSAKTEDIVTELFVDENRIEAARAEAASIPGIDINEVDLQWVQILSEGWAAPLRGFMREEIYLETIHFNTINCNGTTTNQSIPIVLAINSQDKERLEDQSSISLWYKGRAIAILSKPEFYHHRKEERCGRQFGTFNSGHPYVKVSYLDP